VSGDFAEALNKKVEKSSKRSCSKSRSKWKKTVMAKDL